MSIYDINILSLSCRFLHKNCILHLFMNFVSTVLKKNKPRCMNMVLPAMTKLYSLIKHSKDLF